MKHGVLGPKVLSRLFIQNDQNQHFIPVLLSKLSFAECRSKKGKLVFSKSGVFHIWHIVFFIAQRQNVANFHKLVCS